MSRKNKPGNGHLVLSGYWNPDGSHGVKNQFRIGEDMTLSIGKVSKNPDGGTYRVELVFHAPQDVAIWRESIYREMQP